MNTPTNRDMDCLTETPSSAAPSAAKIETRHEHPPIPIRCYDWRAFFADMDEETRGEGWGATEAEAIADLKETYGLWCRQCQKHERDVKSCGMGGCPIGADL